MILAMYLRRTEKIVTPILKVSVVIKPTLKEGHLKPENGGFQEKLGGGNP